MVVRRLLEAVQPHTLYLGQKDYQQVMVIKRLIELMHANITVVSIPTLREADGLAMSSRNVRLSADERATATIIYKAMLGIQQDYGKHTVDELCTAAAALIDSAPSMHTEYVALRDANTLGGITTTTQQVVALVAAFCGEVRLIDNLIIH